MKKGLILGSLRVYWSRYLSNWAIGGAAAIFGAAILVFSILAVTSPLRVLPSNLSLPIEMTIGPTPVAYYLPYPGILPDSPMYKLKAVRDWLKWQLTFGDDNRAKVALLMADKRINAANVLFEGGKAGLALETAIKAERYLQTAVDVTARGKEKGKDVKSMVLTLEKAVTKHGEIIGDLSKKASGEEKKMWEKEVEFNKNLQNKVNDSL